VLERLRWSSPLALRLTFDALQRAASSGSWAQCLSDEAELCAAALTSADFRAGCHGLWASRGELRTAGAESAAEEWAHGDVTAVSDEELEQYMRVREGGH